MLHYFFDTDDWIDEDMYFGEDYIDVDEYTDEELFILSLLEFQERLIKEGKKSQSDEKC